MYRKLLNLAKHSVIYGLGSVATRIVSFLLIPVYTRFMTPSDYGVLALFSTTASVLGVVSLAGLPSALFRSYLHVARREEERRQVLATGMGAMLLLGALTATLVLVFQRRLAGWIFGDPGLSEFVVLLAVTSLSQVFLQFRNAFFRIHDQSARYSFFTVLAFVLTVTLSLVLVVGLRQGAWGAMVANTAAPALIALAFLPWCLGRLRAGFSRRILRDMLAYGLPLVPFGLAVWVMNLSDVYILRIFRDSAEVGLYNLGYRFGLGIYIVTNALKIAYPKVIFSEGKQEDRAPALFARVVTYYAVAVGLLCLSVAVFSREIILVADPSFREAWRVIPLVVSAYFLNGLLPMLQIGFDLRGKIHYVAAIYVVAAALNIALNLIFIPRYGMMAAATTTLVTYALLPLPIYVISARLYPFTLEWARLARAGLVFIAAGLAWWIAPIGPGWGRVIAQAALCLAVVPALWATGFFTAAELRKARALLGAGGAAS